MVKKKGFGLLLVLVPIFASCASSGGDPKSESSSSFSSAEESSSPSSSSSSSSSELPTYREEKFSHVFKKTDFSDYSFGGTASVNGLSFSYTVSPYIGQTSEGVQIGSKKQPQLEAFKLDFALPEGVFVTEYEYYVKGDSGNSSVTVGDYSSTYTFSSKTLEKVSFSDLYGASFSLSLSSSSSSAIYLYSLSLTFEVLEGLDFSVCGDESSATAVVPGENGVPAINFSPKTAEEYYGDFDWTKTGEELRSSLIAMSSSKQLQKYSSAKTMLPYTDENPDKPGYMVGFYDGDDLPCVWDNSWNREHVWACSHLRNDDPNADVRPSESTRNIGTDLFNLHAACLDMNSKHSDKIFGELNSSNAFYPNFDSTRIPFPHKGEGDFRGDVARTVLYMYATYENLQIVEELGEESYVQMGAKSVLLAWNEADPVDDYERQRNERVYAYQGNRNAFIDHPEIAAKLFE